MKISELERLLAMHRSKYGDCEVEVSARVSAKLGRTVTAPVLQQVPAPPIMLDQAPDPPFQLLVDVWSQIH